jgi:tRNA pseudouridine38-40 synthase
MTRFRLLIEYDGRSFVGWQRQVGAPSVQAALEDALLSIVGEAQTVHAAGRTDAGVHAVGMTAHVDVQKAISGFRLMEGLNARLRMAGARVAVLSSEPADPDFHARFACIRRAYEYRIVCRRAPLTHEAGLAWRRPKPLDIGAMQTAAQHLVGRHDFTTFRHVHCQALSPVRTLEVLNVSGDASRVVVSAAERSFLHHQVRSMVGALVRVGEGRADPESVKQALEARDRSKLALNAPPDGLWFLSASY